MRFQRIFRSSGRLAVLFLATALAASCRTPAPQPGPQAATPSSPPQPGSLVMTDQGAGWTDAERKDFYSRDQGSRLIPLRWMTALKTKDGGPFMADSLARYGYLPNPWSIPAGLPVGFTVSGGSEGQTLGMTCSACHTRQIEVNRVSYRIDGGPAVADFQSFMTDLDAAVGRVLHDKAAFADFADSVLSESPSQSDLAKLRKDVGDWYLPFDTLMSKALPKTAPWGPVRIDAVGMILNRLSGLDIGPAPTYMIPGNIKLADAPVRYPFLWNAPRQDYTQWPGFAPNGDNIVALGRNTGEVFGVFAQFHPKKQGFHLLGVDYTANNSANFTGLDALEDLVKKLEKPKWPWPVDQQLADKGHEIYNWPKEQGGCVECHATRPVPRGETRLRNLETWKTPIWDVGTDSREWKLLAWKVDTGILKGVPVPGAIATLQPQDTAVTVLKTAVLGSIIQHVVPGIGGRAGAMMAEHAPTPPEVGDLQNFFTPRPSTQGFAYEARVLEGIWAAAPYLHNGSVPTLAELLKPAAERIPQFSVGPTYDPDNVGLASDQSKFGYVYKTTDCSNRDSGNSRCGHEYGTSLKPDQKKALLEYLKTL